MCLKKVWSYFWDKWMSLVLVRVGNELILFIRRVNDLRHIYRNNEWG